ncbi:MAG: response regulator transcription factor [Chloroflexi bacterium]|nr:response regulator transcription factor [Chloroflexota bacterium]
MIGNKPRILVVDDEPETVKYVGTNLRARGYQVLTAADGTEALKVASEEVLDLIILDIMMPGPDGFEVCQAIRQESEVPIIILSARGQERDKVRALDIGADDYLTKPFGIEELLARVRAALRRSARSEVGPLPPIHTDDLTLDFSRRRVLVRGQEVSLTPTEYNLLAHLARNMGKVLTHRAILQSVWGPEYGDENDYLWAYVRRLRRKLEPDPQHPRYLLTEPGVGYRFEAPGHQESEVGTAPE